jgi:hypothetical protein
MFRFAQHDGEEKNRRTRDASGDLSILSLWRWRSLRFFLSALAGFHFRFRRGHRVRDGHFLANLKISRDFGVGVAIDFPTLLFRALFDHDHRIGNLENRPGHLVSLRTRGKSCAT